MDDSSLRQNQCPIRYPTNYVVLSLLVLYVSLMGYPREHCIYFGLTGRTRTDEETTSKTSF